MRPVSVREGRPSPSGVGAKFFRAALLASSAAALALGIGACASARYARGDGIHAEIVDSKEGRTLTGDRLFYVTLAYRDGSGASCTTTVQVDQLTWMRLKSADEPCIVPDHEGYRVATCR